MRKSFSWKVERGTAKGNEQNIRLRYEGMRMVADMVADIDNIYLKYFSIAKRKID